MARLFPFRSETPSQEGQPRVVELEGEDADAVFSALSSTTARQIYSRLDAEPGTPSDVADAIDSSIQNVRYHLENLEEAGLVEVVDTWYSSRGNEMSVYATTDGPLIVTSDESRASQLKAALSRLIGGIGALAGGSLLVQYGLVRWLGSAGSRTESGSGSGSGSGMSPMGTDDAADAAEPDAADSADETARTEDAGSREEGDSGADAADAAAEESDDGATENGAEADAADVEAYENGTSEGADPGVGDSMDGDYLTGDGAADGGAEAADAVLSTVPPGLLFFLGGLVVLLAVWAYWYWYRPTY